MNLTINKKFPKLIALFFVIVLIGLLIKFFPLITSPKVEAVAVNGQESTSTVTTVKKKVINYGKEIAAQNIFGKAIVQPKQDQSTKVTQPTEPVKVVTKINAKLHGIVAYRSQKGFALISNKNGPQKVYGESDTLQEGVTISKVLSDKVILDNNGKEEELLLPVKEEGKSAKSSKREVASRQRKQTQSRAGSSNDLPDLTQIKKDVLSDPSKLTDIVRATPALINGKFTGFKVRSGKNRKLFNQLNFRNNDIITQVNGIVLDNQSKALQVLTELETATDLSITVKRGTEDVFINHSF